MKWLFTVFVVCIGELVWAQNSATVYIDQYKDMAIQQMNEHGLPASIVLAVAMHESGNGTSRLARIQHNHFGMKGRSYSAKIRSSYKSYDSVALSYADFSSMLKSRKQFRVLFDRCDRYDYKAWAWGMQKAQYAANKAWASRVVALIKKYKLYQYDDRPVDYVELQDNDNVPRSSRSKHRRIVYYHIKKGDTLSSLAKKYGTTVAKLQSRNHLKTTQLQIGQKIKLACK
ncbi:MAG: glucosaminidase domain-containing protein [Sphingobacteriaceae bacterium]|jgi:LysM repeat protein|nr:MAG: LysM peptidoglycan-binding domain-containing protein [Pedobacter sp.]